MAILRLVAIKEDFQRKGRGRELLALSEEFAISKGCTKLALNAALDAVAFYKKIGFNEVMWSKDEQHEDHIQMMKVISSHSVERTNNI